jgi:hypothetical protein
MFRESEEVLRSASAYVLEFDGLAVDADGGRRDPAGNLAGFHYALHEGFHEGPVLLRRREPVRVLRSAILLVVALSSAVFAQRGRGAQGGGATPRAAASVDLTGYWVSVVTEDWRFRMVTPKKGDHPSVPLNAEGVRVAGMWDPVKDEAAGEQCKAYGAAGVMRVPGRLRITWEDDTTLKVETEAGTQTRLLRFGSAQPSPSGAGSPTWQGESAAQWEFPAGRRGGQGGPAQNGNLKVVTTRMRPGYLQKNGVPYGGNAVLTEYFARTVEPNGDSWLILTAIVEDPQYLTGRFLRSTHYKRMPDNNSTWEPEPCSAQ